jgi:hypothetical protein
MRERRDRYGLNYHRVGEDQAEALAPLVALMRSD